MVLDPIPQSLPVHIFGSRPQPPTSPCASSTFKKSAYSADEFRRKSGFLSTCGKPQVEKDEKNKSPVVTMWCAAARLKPLRRRAPVGGRNSLGATLVKEIDQVEGFG